MSTRNLIWLIAIVVVGAAVWIATSWLWGVIAAAALLIVSEFVERTRRRRRAAAAGTEPRSLRSVITTRRRSR